MLAQIAQPTENSEEVKQKLINLLRYPRLQGDALLDDLPRLLELHGVCAMHDGALASMITIHYNLCMGSIKSLGNGSQYVRGLYQQLNDGQAIGVYLATELGYGNNLFSLETEARYCPVRQVFVLNSPSSRSCKFMPNATSCGLPKIAVVMARLVVGDHYHGVLPFLVPLRADGAIRITPLSSKPGFHLDNAMTSFDSLELPFDALLQKGIIELKRDGQLNPLNTTRTQRFLQSVDRVQTGKLCMAACALGGTKAALHINFRYAQQRQSFGARGATSLLSYPTYRHPLALDVVQSLVHSIWFDELVAEHGKNALKPMLPDLLNEVAILKALSTWSSQEIAVRCRERCGAQGLFSANKIIDYVLASNGAITAEGDNLVVMLKAAAHFLRQLQLPCVQRSVDARQQSLLKCLDDGIHALRAIIIAAPDRQAQTEDMLILARLLGVRMAVTRYIAHVDNSGLDAAILELFLLAQLQQHALVLIRTSAVSSTQIRAWDKRTRTLLKAHAEQILGRINTMGITALKVAAPIASEDYIEHFARQHRGRQAEHTAPPARTFDISP
ncbi:acyl-CoA dehydrogenase family protein [Pseudomonas putida]